MGFREGRIEEEKVFGGVVFPKTLLPPEMCDYSGDVNYSCDLAEMVKGEVEFLSETLQRHGAILFRGFPRVDSAEAFDRVVEAFGWENMAFVSAVTRVRLTDRVFTASEVAVDKFIGFHHEMSLCRATASKIFFFCLEAPPEGGETAILPSHVVVEKMEEKMPELVAKLEEVGLVYRVGIHGGEHSDRPTTVLNTWKQMLQTDDEIEAEKRFKEILVCNSVELKSDGSVEFVYGPMNPIREVEVEVEVEVDGWKKKKKKRVWFISMLGYTSNPDDVKNSFGDGSGEIPPEALAVFGRILQDNCVDLKWEKGDVLLLDNFSVQHARRPGKPPRVLYASICK